MGKILVIGSMNLDYVINVDAMPAVGETVLSKGLSLIPGGKGANQAYTIGKLGGKVSMLGAVGADKNGELLCENLQSVGVDVSRVYRREDAETGMAMVCVDARGDNSIIVVQGANRFAGRACVQENADLLEACDVVVMQLEIPLNTVAFAAQEAHRLGKTVVLDPAPAVENLPRELLQNVDILKPNEVELGVLLGDPYAKDHLRRSCEKLLEMGVSNVLVTLGGEGAYLLEQDGTEHRFPPFLAGPVVDTTAAGDSFTAALALGISQGRDLKSSAEFASRVSGIVVTRKGAQTSIPSLREVEEAEGESPE